MKSTVGASRLGVLHSETKELYFPSMSIQADKAAFFRTIDPSQLALLFDFLPDVSFYVKDRAGRFMAANRRFCEYCGVRFEHEVLGKTDHDIFPKPRADHYVKSDAEVMGTGRAMLSRLHSAPEREGSPRVVSSTKVPLRDGRGRIVGVAGFSRPAGQVSEATANVTRLSKVVERLYARPAEPHPTAELANMAGLSPSQFDRSFRAAFGISCRQYLLRTRVEAACRSLAGTNRPVSEVALECGFYDHAHFIRCFRRLMNTTPTAYRRAHRQAADR